MKDDNIHMEHSINGQTDRMNYRTNVQWSVQKVDEEEIERMI